jgi:hypothetical protein
MNATQIRAAQPTGDRTVTVSFNHSESVVTERAFLHRRTSSQIRPQPANVSSLLQTAHGHWILEPLQDVSLTHEKGDLHQYQLRVSQCSVAPHVREIAFHRKFTELSGVAPSAAVATTGDYYMLKRIGSSESWNQAVISGPAPPTLPTAHYPLDRVMVGPNDGGPIPESNTGWLLKVRVPGAAGQTPDFFAGFRFGGAQAGTDPNGYGLFYLAFAGDGHALLYEFIEGVWKNLAGWRWGTPSDTPTLMLVCRIIPYGSQWIEFSTFNAGSSALTLELINPAALHDLRGNKNQSKTSGIYAYTATNRIPLAGQLQDEFGLFPVTGPGMCAVDIRRDLRAMWQVSRIVYPQNGLLDDAEFQVPYGYGSAHVLTIDTEGEAVSLNGIADAATIGKGIVASGGGVLTSATEDYTLGGVTYTGPTALQGFNPPGGANQCQARIQLINLQSGVRYQTPVLTGYTIRRRPHLQTVSPTVYTPATVTQVSITGAGTEPDQETAFVAIEDLTAAGDVLRTYGKQPVRITTTYTGQGGNPDIILFEGYVGRATGKQKGKTGKVFPSANWRRYECELLGKWDRVAAGYFHERFNFADAGTSPSGPSPDPTDPGWLVTDVLRVLLEHAGFQDSQVDIPNSPIPIRLFASAKGQAEELLSPTLGTWIGDYLKRICADYLGRWFLFDANAGASGMWRTIIPPSGATPGAVWTFTTAVPAANKLGHLSASYGASTSPILNMLDEYVVAPEFAILTVRGAPGIGPDGVVRYPQHTYRNPAAFNSPTHPATADNTNLDYLPRPQEAIYNDPALPNIRAVKFIGRRLMERAGHGQKWRSFIAETVLLPAATFEPLIYTTRLKRPLMPGDVVLMDSDRYVIQSNNCAFRKSGVMMSMYEAQLYREGLAWG